MEAEFVNAIKDFGFPVIAALGMGYFVFFIWKWVTETIDPVIGDAQKTLIALVDRIRMLDNDMIRLNTKLSMLLKSGLITNISADPNIFSLLIFIGIVIPSICFISFGAL